MKIATDNKDLKVLKDANDGINFQKASCTLDGCVKIYSSRVDSVDSDTRKLMNGTVESNEPAEAKKRRKATATIETNLDNINSKKLESEYAVDPLFKKTCADFDQGGASGLLLNHLSIGRDGRIIFDAGDVLAIDISSNLDDDLHLQTIDMQHFSHLLPSLRNLDDFEICSSLKNFAFNSKNASFNPQLYLDQVESLFVGRDDAEHVSDFNDNDEGGFGYDDINNSILPVQHHISTEDQNALPQILSQMNRRYSLMPTHHPEGAELEEEGESGLSSMFSYFDKEMMRQWAGPTKLAKRFKHKTTGFSITVNIIKVPAKKTKATLSFTCPPAKALFAKPKNLATLDAAMQEDDDHLLPEDMHITSLSFTRLFTKPDFVLKFNRKVNVVKCDDVDEDNVDVVFWASNDVEAAKGSLVCIGLRQDIYEPVGDTGFGGDDDENDHSETELPIYPSNRIKPLNYAKTSKKVDIKLLKDNIWKNVSASITSKSDVAFTKMVGELGGDYGQREWGDISVQFCFICLLHLANENGLEVKGSTRDGDVCSELVISR